MGKLLVVEDDNGIKKQLKWGLSDYDIVFASHYDEAIAHIRRHEPQVISLDLGLPPDPDNVSEGFKILAQINQLLPQSKVIVLTGNNQPEVARKAIAMGAYDFYEKPINIDILNIMLSRAFRVATLEKQHHGLQQIQYETNDLIGVSTAVNQIRHRIVKIATTHIRTLILGESGTGKEVIAQLIHRHSSRREKPFIAINCASIPENLLESELFGFERGAFTGAHKTTIGKIEQAHQGTLFLDEIGDMPLSLQAKLLRFLQESVIERLGGRKEIAVDVKVVCATHQNLEQMMAEKRFRDDLYYRISEIVMISPPLRERGEDVILLAKHFLHTYQQDIPSKVRGFSDEALQAIACYSWPGNIRELQNKIKTAMVLCDSKLISSVDLMLPNSDIHTGLEINLRKVREEAEIAAITKALALSEGNVSQSATLLGIARPTLYSLMEKYAMSGS